VGCEHPTPWSTLSRPILDLDLLDPDLAANSLVNVGLEH
jgi:hypothetical protein